MLLIDVPSSSAAESCSDADASWGLFGGDRDRSEDRVRTTEHEILPEAFLDVLDLIRGRGIVCTLSVSAHIISPSHRDPRLLIRRPAWHPFM